MVSHTLINIEIASMPTNKINNNSLEEGNIRKYHSILADGAVEVSRKSIMMTEHHTVDGSLEVNGYFSGAHAIYNLKSVTLEE